MNSEVFRPRKARPGRRPRRRTTSPPSARRCIARLRAGGMAILGDGIGVSPRYDLICLADRLTVEHTAFLVRHTSGLLQVALRDEALGRLQIPPVAPSVNRMQSQQCVGVDAAVGIGTGISAIDRTRTINTLGRPDAVAGDFTRPGHVLPVRVAGHPPRRDVAGAALQLAECSGSNAVVFATVVGSEPDSTGLLQPTEAVEFAGHHDIPIISYTDARLATHLDHVLDLEQPNPGHTGQISLDGAS
ncbi:3,4-dihydroxy-2-butanone-4-phosphate synthase [Rhodococcus sp. NPDC058521]|uniref:3,4-dihydroxy-2-butanone-4-phosphate synthase n=1 Tax=Rhodococcus sp. NPDC058521 TaxID=3346536 RepID=UPI00365F12AF